MEALRNRLCPAQLYLSVPRNGRLAESMFAAANSTPQQGEDWPDEELRIVKCLKLAGSGMHPEEATIRGRQTNNVTSIKMAPDFL